ncbi:MAG: hypothetical protein B6229_00940 [Spirochaetaceae bacterium 4572_7]|nr:MAG: hypothetical protein B6229_00940 [Spirochaetaceae bacterium 4572_7]
MSQNTSEKKSNNQNKGKRRPPWRNGGGKKKKTTTVAKFTCPVCNEGVKELGNAIDFEGKGPTHFDCVLRVLTQKEHLNPGEKIAYVGSGRFGVIINKKNDAGGPFTLVREIDVEDPNKSLNWRDEKKVYVSIEEKKPN